MPTQTGTPVRGESGRGHAHVQLSRVREEGTHTYTHTCTHTQKGVHTLSKADSSNKHACMEQVRVPSVPFNAHAHGQLAYQTR